MESVRTGPRAQGPRRQHVDPLKMLPMTRNPTRSISQAVLRFGGRRILARDAELTISGRERIPAEGPCVLVAHHYHHLLDGCAMYAATDRPIHILVGLDWAGTGLQRRGMEVLCRMAGWPVIERPGALNRSPASAAREGEGRALMRQAMRASMALLRAGEMVVVFPEGYPVIDPHGSPKQETGATFLPFQHGVVRMVRMAEAGGIGPIPLIPVGFDYRQVDGGRWRIAMNIDDSVRRSEFADDGDCLLALESEVRRLSGAAGL